MDFGFHIRLIDDPYQIADWATLAEANGFDYVYLSDSHSMWRDVYVTLGLIADQTTDIKIGTGVTNPLSRHPTVTANAIATIDDLADGRAFLGLGRGGSAMRAMGRRKPASFRETRECIELLREYWTGEPIGFGETTTGLQWSDPRSIPIFIVAGGPDMLEFASKFGDGVIFGYINHPPMVEQLVHEVTQVRTNTATRSTQDFQHIVHLSTAISDDTDRAYRLVKPMVVGIIARHPEFARACGVEFDVDEYRALDEEIGDINHTPDWENAMERSEFVSDAAVQRLTLAGEPTDIVEQIHDLEAAGVDQLFVRPFFSHSISNEKEYQQEYLIETFGNEIIPAFG